MHKTNTVRVQVQNIAADTLDSARVKIQTYNSSGHKGAKVDRLETRISPLFWRNNDCYNSQYASSLITITARDGTIQKTGSFYHNKK